MKFTRWWLLPKRRKIYPRFKIGCTCHPTTYSTIRLVLFPAFIRHLVSISTSTWWSDIRTFLLHALEDGQDPLPDVSFSQRTKGIQSHRANSRRRGLLWGEKLSDLRIITGHDFRNVRRNSRLQRSPRPSSEIDEGVKLMFLWRPCLILYCIVSCIF